MSRIDKSTTIAQMEDILGEEAFGGYLMECRPDTCERFSGVTIGQMEDYYGRAQAGRMLAGVRALESAVGAGRTVALDVYTPEEVAADPTKAVVRLFFLPGRPGAPFCLMCPGGSYQSVCSLQEGFPAAADVTRAGYNAFVLTYRTRMNGVRPRPLECAFEDLSRAVRLVLERADEFQVARDYTVWGWSAGGHLAAEWGTDNWGASHWGLPAARGLVLGYPAIDFHTMFTTVEEGEREPFYQCVLGSPARLEALDEYAVSRHVGESYPPTFVWQCEDDDVVPFENFTRMMAALREAGVRHEGVAYGHGGHGLTKPHGPEADGWVRTALAFVDALFA